MPKTVFHGLKDLVVARSDRKKSSTAIYRNRQDKPSFYSVTSNRWWLTPPFFSSLFSLVLKGVLLPLFVYTTVFQKRCKSPKDGFRTTRKTLLSTPKDPPARFVCFHLSLPSFFFFFPSLFWGTALTSILLLGFVLILSTPFRLYTTRSQNLVPIYSGKPSL